MEDHERIDEIRKRLKQMAQEIEKLDQLVARLKEEIEQQCQPPAND
jgi:prefoldin subunit 5